MFVYSEKCGEEKTIQKTQQMVNYPEVKKSIANKPDGKPFQT